jgi:Amt family ammonium transporter
MYTGSAHQLWEQFRAALFVIFWSSLVTFILMKLIGLVLRGARYKDEILEIGDLAIHDEEAFPEAPLAERVGGGGPGAGGFELAGVGTTAPPPLRGPEDPPLGSSTESTQ